MRPRGAGHAVTIDGVRRVVELHALVATFVGVGGLACALQAAGTGPLGVAALVLLGAAAIGHAGGGVMLALAAERAQRAPTRPVLWCLAADAVGAAALLLAVLERHQTGPGRMSHALAAGLAALACTPSPFDLCFWFAGVRPACFPRTPDATDRFAKSALVALLLAGCVVAPAAISGIGGARIPTNESSAIGSLRSLAAAQARFQRDALVDQDGDGVGEFGLLGELAGTASLRGSARTLAGRPYIATIFGVCDARGVAQKSGYCFRCFLPHGADVLTDAARGVSAPVHRPAADAQEAHWVCYAWPVANGASGRRAFVVMADGVVCATDNAATTQHYSGSQRAPGADAARRRAGPDARPGDGGTWTPLP